MTRTEALESLMSSAARAYNIDAQGAAYKEALKDFINEAGASIATAKVFLGWVEAAFEDGKVPNLRELMFTAAIFTGNCCGLDPTRVNEIFTPQDSMDLVKVNHYDVS